MTPGADTFDPNDKTDVKALQEGLNTFNALGEKLGKGEKEPLQLTGIMDTETQSAWLSFKKEVFADSSLSLGFLKDQNGLGFTDNELKTLGVGERYNRNAPPTELIKAVQNKIHIDSTGEMDQPTQEAIINLKREHWIDGRINEGALDDLNKAIDQRQKTLQSVSESKGYDSDGMAAGHTAHTAGRDLLQR